ncbi:MAG: ATP-binding protein [Elusimicrobiota bacterium]
MSYYELSALVNFITSTVLGVIVLYKNPHSKLNRSFFYFALSVLFWSLAYFFWQTALNAKNALFWSRALMASAIFVTPTFYHLTVTLIEKQKEKFKTVKAWYGFFLIFFLINFTSLFISDVESRLFFRFWPVPGMFFTPFLVIWLGLAFYSHLLMYKSRKYLSINKWNQVKYVFYGTAIGFIGGSTNYFLWYGIPIPPVGNIFVSLWVISVFYAIVKYRLMDIKVAITRATAFGIIYAFVLGIPFLMYFFNKQLLINTFGLNWPLVPIITAVVLGSMGPGIYAKLKNKAEWTLFKEQKRYRETLFALAKKITLSKNLDKLLEMICLSVYENIGIEGIKVFLWDEEKNKYVLKKEQGFEKTESCKKEYAIEEPLIHYLKQIQKPVLKDEIINYQHTDSAALTVPIFTEDHLQGFIIIGDKKDKKMYSPEDLEMFDILSEQLSLAIENALFYDKVKAIQEKMLRTEKLAMMGKLAGAVGHDIRTPLSSIKYISYYLNEYTGTGIKDEEFKKHISILSSETEHAEEIVSSLMELSKRKIKKKEICLREAIQEIISRSRIRKEIKVINRVPGDIYINADPGRFRRLMQNLIKNAAQAIIKEGEIQIKAVRNSETYISIKDNGTGMDKETEKNIYEPLYTTKETGMGLGMSIIKDIIDKHDWELKLKSEKGKGTEFIIKIDEES